MIRPRQSLCGIKREKALFVYILIRLFLDSMNIVKKVDILVRISLKTGSCSRKKLAIFPDSKPGSNFFHSFIFSGFAVKYRVPIEISID